MSVQSNINQMLSITGLMYQKKGEAMKAKKTKSLASTPSPVKNEKKPEIKSEDEAQARSEEITEVVDMPSSGSPIESKELRMISRHSKMPRGTIATKVAIEQRRRERVRHGQKQRFNN